MSTGQVHGSIPLAMNPEQPKYPAQVASVKSDKVLVINRGSKDGVKPGQRFLVYEVEQEETIDPSTGRSLGHLEVVKGSGVVIHVQDQMATIQSDTLPTPRKVIVRENPLRAMQKAILGTVVTSPALLGDEIAEIPLPERVVGFEDPKVGDYAKPI